MLRASLYLPVLILVACLPPVVRGQDITSNLHGHWKLTETSGTLAVDSSATANHGTYLNGVTLANSTPVPSDGAVAARFDGSNDFVAIPNEWYYDGVGAFSVAVWIKVNAFTTADQAILTKGATSSVQLQRDGSNNGVAFICHGLTTIRVASTVSVNDGKWHHVAGVFTGSQLRVYIDGLLNNSVNTTGFVSTNNYPLQIGSNAEVTGKNFNGWMYDIRLYSRALPAADVAYLYLQGGPVGHWKLRETSGTTAADSSLYGRNGTVYGGASWTTRCNGAGAFDFNGSTQYISVTNAAQLQPTTALTIAAWIRGDSWGAGTDTDTILRKGEANPNNYALAISDGRVELLLDSWDASGFRGNTVLNTNEWYHVAATWDGANVRIYVNGVLDNTPASRTGTIGADTRPVYIGGRSGADLFDGLLQDMRLYNRALSPIEIERLAGLAGHWRFAEGSGTTAADSTAASNTAALSGGAGWTSDCVGNNSALLTTGMGGIAQTAAAFTPPDEGTVAFWMRSNGNPTALGRIFGLGGDWEVRQMTDGSLVFDLCGEGGGHFETTVPLNEVGRWYHVAASFDASSRTYAIYLDGQLNKSGVNGNNMGKQWPAILSFGTRTGSTEYWGGALRDVRIYSRRLCPSEIAELYGLVGHWTLNETSGTAVADSSGLNRNGTVIGTVNWVGGTVGNCLKLDGATRVEINSLMGSPRNVTIAGWAFLSTPDSSGAEIVSIGDYFALRLDNGSTSRAFFYNGTTWVSTSVNQTFAAAGWHHFAAVFNDDRDYCKLFVDGLEVASVSTTVTIPFTGLGTKTVIGAHGNGSTIFDFTGRIDDVRIYNRALCPGEIQTLYNMGGGDAFGGVKVIKWIELQ
jgi:hypothetical protein